MTEQDIINLIIDPKKDEDSCLAKLSSYSGSYDVGRLLKFAAYKGYTKLCNYLIKRLSHSKDEAHQPAAIAAEIAISEGQLDTAIAIIDQLSTRESSLAFACNKGNFYVVKKILDSCSTTYSNQPTTMIELIESAQKAVGSKGDYKEISRFLKSTKIELTLLGEGISENQNTSKNSKELTPMNSL